jgi:hypothetical protein
MLGAAGAAGARAAGAGAAGAGAWTVTVVTGGAADGPPQPTSNKTAAVLVTRARAAQCRMLCSGRLITDEVEDEEAAGAVMCRAFRGN